ncbi:hypothetical protein [Anaerotruncus colihominis]
MIRCVIGDLSTSDERRKACQAALASKAAGCMMGVATPVDGGLLAME